MFKLPKYILYPALWVLLLAAGDVAGYAQSVFRGVLLNQLDSSVIPYAAVNVKETGVSIVTDSNGAFRAELPGRVKQLTLEITAIGVKTVLSYKPPFEKTVRIYLDISANMLDGVAIRGLSAEEVVRVAVASIPANSADSSYFDLSFYRRYQLVNSRYVNLFEAAPEVMFQLAKNKQRLSAKEAYAVTQLRRTRQHPNISNVIEDNPADLLIENPVYHVDGSSIDPRRFKSYRFSFDTTHKTKDYVIRYVCRESSTDHHGVPDYGLRGLEGETWESGELVIERGSFAIKRIHRVSHRYEDYNYKWFPPQNNLVIFDHRTYCFSFKGGDMLTEYKQRNGKWYLDKIVRQYRDQFIWPGFESLEFDITDHFEWYSESVSRYTTGEYIDKFYPKMATAIHSYDTTYWQRENPPFHYTTKEAVYKDLRRDGPVTKQFYEETMVDEVVKRKPHK